MKLIFTHDALHSLQNIGDFIVKDNPSRALTFVMELETRCKELLNAPQAYPVVLQKNNYSICRLVHGNYLIFYRVDKSAVIVLHV